MKAIENPGLRFASSRLLKWAGKDQIAVIGLDGSIDHKGPVFLFQLILLGIFCAKDT
ncbi:hypothetical protein [Methylomonas rivi]|uniref:Uncharacterized protein n=1 Tax=Methylomonas rivi TaxID=2952226 RepID=A0ABT1UA80_9GAMM|nr:hypothetical protein [Methylomonas sp. WSC-6]MCQ8130279.1 hypothetical protein [Methylomonas sp. WSC-6]